MRFRGTGANDMASLHEQLEASRANPLILYYISTNSATPRFRRIREISAVRFLRKALVVIHFRPAVAGLQRVFLHSAFPLFLVSGLTD